MWYTDIKIAYHPKSQLLRNYILSKLNSNNGICHDIQVKDILCWNDLEISLPWIKGINSEFKTFI